LSARALAYRQLFARSRVGEKLSATNQIMIVVIIAAVLSTILSTEAALRTEHRATFIAIESCFGVIFATEYAARVWAIAEDRGEESALRRRLRFMRSPMAIIDLIVVVSTLSPYFISDAAILRMLRLLRLAALAKFGRFSVALRELAAAVSSRRYELFVTLALALGLLLFGATALFWAEREVQPEEFGSIPRALWWSVITLTTVGYGDVSPITPIGKALASVVAISGIGLVAMPAGIMASAFSDAMERRRRLAEEIADQVADEHEDEK
jgi:voltage-gated potassium channel